MTMLIPQGDAVFSADGRYRYRLTRDLGGKTTVTFIMLNPSTADANLDDPTIRRCKGFAKDWGYGRLIIVNLFAFRATDPRDMWKAHELGVNVIGELPKPAAPNAPMTVRLFMPPRTLHVPMDWDRNINDMEIFHAACDADENSGIVVAAWGKGGGRTAPHRKVIGERAAYVHKMIGGNLWCLGTNEDGSPKHPLYLPETTEAVEWRAA
jgi:hypothetical protein